MLLFLACRENDWTPFIFLELYPVRKVMEVPENECHICGLDSKCHPMMPIKYEHYKEAYEKYCLKDFLKYGFVKINEVW